MRRVLLLSALGLIGCSAAKADPSPDLAARPRIELRTVKQNFSAIIGAYIRDNEIQAPVALAAQLAIGSRVVFADMAIYTMVKNNTFNGMALPAIAVMEEDGNCKVIREFGYEDFKGRLA